MSDVTQDQLYLAFRLASLEKFSAAAEPLPLPRPLPLDDAFVNFDKAPARAVLTVLAKLRAKTQVVFFTHIQHMVNPATEAVDGQIHIDELNST
jgi:uncharacterized protein YhaN